MCFKHLPVEFDEAGRARLKDGVPDPYSFAIARPEVAETDAEREQLARERGAPRRPEVSGSNGES